MSEILYLEIQRVKIKASHCWFECFIADFARTLKCSSHHVLTNTNYLFKFSVG